ncbi:MAG: TMEM175 family protein [Parvularculaceae bacterium]|nr:TMEM175 family protein [Parvularculaceae bacterium]
MGKERLLAFSDGVIAIIITIMVLEMHAPHEPTLKALAASWPVFLSYVLSFVNVGIYWNNHHHLLHGTERVNAGILWANLALLFFLSLIPFATAWLGETQFASVPTALYGAVLLAPAIAYYVLQTLLLREGGPESVLARALRSDWKGKLSPLAYVVAIPLALVEPWASLATYLAVALIWLIPDPRVERAMRELESASR